MDVWSIHSTVFCVSLFYGDAITSQEISTDLFFYHKAVQWHRPQSSGRIYPLEYWTSQNQHSNLFCSNKVFKHHTVAFSVLPHMVCTTCLCGSAPLSEIKELYFTINVVCRHTAINRLCQKCKYLNSDLQFMQQRCFDVGGLLNFIRLVSLPRRLM